MAKRKRKKEEESSSESESESESSDDEDDDDDDEESSEEDSPVKQTKKNVKNNGGKIDYTKRANLPKGWTLTLTVRESGKCAGTIDKMWVSPNGKKFRSAIAVERWLAMSDKEREKLKSKKKNKVPPRSQKGVKMTPKIIPPDRTSVTKWKK
jgi:hypothetical protein